METITSRAPADRSTGSDRPRRRLRRRPRALVVLEVVLSVCGLGGGTFMATHPTTAMSLDYLQGTGFHTWRWPGIALLFFVGVGPAAVAAATLLRFPVAPLGHVCVGVGLVAWILLELTWIVVVSPALQVVFGAVGVTIAVLGVAEIRHPGHEPVTLDPGRAGTALRR